MQKLIKTRNKRSSDYRTNFYKKYLQKLETECKKVWWLVFYPS